MHAAVGKLESETCGQIMAEGCGIGEGRRTPPSPGAAHL